jgi:hypothetical protein
MPTKLHTLMSSKVMRDDLARIFAAASPKVRAMITHALVESEKKIQSDPYSCSSLLYKLPSQNMQARIAFFLPLAIYFAVDDEKGKVYVHKIDLVSDNRS